MQLVFSKIILFSLTYNNFNNKWYNSNKVLIEFTFIMLREAMHNQMFWPPSCSYSFNILNRDMGQQKTIHTNLEYT